jgi:hypothetical protein
LAADVEALGRADVAQALLWAVQRFAAPVYFGEELADVWGVPSFIATWLRTDAWHRPNAASESS